MTVRYKWRSASVSARAAFSSGWNTMWLSRLNSTTSSSLRARLSRVRAHFTPAKPPPTMMIRFFMACSLGCDARTVLVVRRTHVAQDRAAAAPLSCARRSGRIARPTASVERPELRDQSRAQLRDLPRHLALGLRVAVVQRVELGGPDLEQLLRLLLDGRGHERRGVAQQRDLAPAGDAVHVV